MYSFCQDMPGITVDQQAELEREIPATALAGCVAHVVGDYDGGVRMIDVWVDEDSYRRFQREHLWPAIDRMRSTLTTLQTGPLPAFTVVEVHGRTTDAA